jgi:hypothetical protein
MSANNKMSETVNRYRNLSHNALKHIAGKSRALTKKKNNAQKELSFAASIYKMMYDDEHDPLKGNSGSKAKSMPRPMTRNRMRSSNIASRAHMKEKLRTASVPIPRPMTRNRSHSASIASLAQSKDLLRTENEELKSSLKKCNDEKEKSKQMIHRHESIYLDLMSKYEDEKKQSKKKYDELVNIYDKEHSLNPAKKVFYTPSEEGFYNKYTPYELRELLVSRPGGSKIYNKLTYTPPSELKKLLVESNRYTPPWLREYKK